MNNKKIKRLLAIFFLVDILFLGVYGYLFYVVDSKNRETAALYTASHQAASDKEKIQGLERTLKETEKERNNLSGYFVTKTNAVTFIEQIEKIGKNANVSLTVNSVSDDVKDNGAIQLNFSAVGSFPDMYRLIALVESMPYKVTLKKANVLRVVDQAVWRGDFVVKLESFTVANATTSPPTRASDSTTKK